MLSVTRCRAIEKKKRNSTHYAKNLAVYIV